MKQVYVFVLFLDGCLVAGLCSTAQSTAADSAFRSRAMAGLQQSYKKEIAENLRLYNGTQYLRQGHGVNGFPFFQWSSVQEGTVFYDGNCYEQVPMQYDLQEDNLVINDYTGNNFIRLIKNKVRYFIIAGHRFVLLDEGEGLPVPGFYEQLYGGAVNAWARRQKVTTQVLNAAGNDLRYTQYNSWFIEKQGVFYAVESEHAVLAVLGDKKDALKKYIRSAGLRFKKDPEGFLAKAIDYYTQPNH